MFDNLEGFPKILAYALMFPTLFQKAFLSCAWGAHDPMEMAIAKRVLILLPVLGLIFNCWMSTLCALSVIFRSERGSFIEKFLVTWWDTARSMFFFWSGLVRLVFFLIVW